MDALSWKEQLEKNEKLKSFKLESPDLETFCFNWKAKRSWKELSEVGEFLLKLENFADIDSYPCSLKVLAVVGRIK